MSIKKTHIVNVLHKLTTVFCIAFWCLMIHTPQTLTKVSIVEANTKYITKDVLL